MRRPGKIRWTGPLLLWLTCAGGVRAADPIDPYAPFSDELEEKMVPPELTFDSVEEEVTAVARVFAETLGKAEAELLASMGADPFTFAGRQVEGREAIEAWWKKIFARYGRSLQKAGPPRVEPLQHARAMERFGALPSKYDHLNPKACWFAVVTFPKRRGVVLILGEREREAGWSVVGVTD